MSMSKVEGVVVVIGFIEAVLVIPLSYYYIQILTSLAPVSFLGFCSMVLFGMSVTFIVSLGLITLSVLPIIVIAVMASRIYVGALDNDHFALIEWSVMQGLLIAGAAYFDDLRDPYYLADIKILTLIIFKILCIPIVLIRILQIIFD